ncbi:MAG: dihydroorotate dehydrogenase electron transfer subunit [Clostridiaceae bacterium]|nr:dihydroorotate dehydrogenase electron transfer subunit [Clostridiaceae bacterium]
MEHQRIEYQARIESNRRLNSQAFVLTLAAPEICVQAQPGQFVHLSCNHFLRRPFGIMSVERSAGLISLGIRIQGDGSRWLSECQAGSCLSVLGPLGHGFSLDGYRRVITVGGGSGVFPLHFVQQACREQAIESYAVCGYRSLDESVITEDYSRLGCKTLFASDLGDMDIPGNAAQALRQLLQTLPPVDGTVVLACGPKPMMQAVAELAGAHKLPCQVSLEERMACGVGVCLVCVCRIKAEQEGRDVRHLRCCVEGPVFQAEEVVW